MTAHITPSQEVDIINAFTVDLEPVMSISKRIGITRQGVYKVLKRNGIDPSEYGKISLSCTCCGEEIRRHRNQVRRNKHLFCSSECYYAWVEGRQQGDPVASRQGQRYAWLVVSTKFDLKPGHIVHHEDRNNNNNELSNLTVFANQGDHIRHHRLGPDYVRPIWSGK